MLCNQHIVKLAFGLSRVISNSMSLKIKKDSFILSIEEKLQNEIANCESCLGINNNSDKNS